MGREEPACNGPRLQVAAGAAVHGARQIGHVGGEWKPKAAFRGVIVREKANAVGAALAVRIRELQQMSGA